MIEAIKLPKLAANMKSGKITKWLKQKGEHLNTGEPLLEVSTGKVNVQVDSPISGELLEILIPEGAEAPVGAEIAIIKVATDETDEAGVESSTQTAQAAQAVQTARPADEQFDLVIIGGGPGGYVAAIRASQLGKRVALVENDKLGGTCLNRGCIPSKAMIKSAEFYTKMKTSAAFGIELGEETGVQAGMGPGGGFSTMAPPLKINFTKIMERKNSIVNQLRAGVEQQMHKNKISLYQGTGSLLGKNRVMIAAKGENAELTAKDIIIASGSLPASLPVTGSGKPGVLNSDTMFEIDQIPESIVVIGGGYIAIEMGCFFNAVGSRVTIIEMQPRILPFADYEISNELHDILVNDGISIYTDTKVKGIAHAEDGGLVVLAANSRDREKFFYCKNVLNATGRICNSEGLNLDAIGLEMDGRAVKVNGKMQTNIPNIYAIGDVTGKAMLAHVASYEGIIAAENIAGSDRQADYSVIPSVIFSDPEIGYAGLTEAEARERGLEFTVSSFPLSASGKALTAGETKGKCKVICCKNTGQILGAHMIGSRATDLIATLAVSMKNGITVGQLTHTIFAHPTTAEIIMEAAGMATGKPIHFPGGNF